MFRKNELKKIVLRYVEKMGVANSRQISTRLWYLGVSNKNYNKTVSMTLLKCSKQRLLERTLVKRGRVREYFYTLTERGRKRLAYYAMKEREVKCGVVDVDELVKKARNQVAPLYLSFHCIFGCAENVCNNTRQSVVFSMGRQCAALSVYLVLKKHELISAFAAKELLSLIAPETSAAIEDALTKPSIENLVDVTATSSVGQRLNRLSEPCVLPFRDILLIPLIMKRMKELHEGQWVLGRMLQEEQEDKEKYRRLYENERAYRMRARSPNMNSGSSRDLPYFGAHLHFNNSLPANFLKYAKSTRDIIKTDLMIIEYLIKRGTHAKSLDILCIVHYLIACLEENNRLAADNRKLEEKVESLEEKIQSLQDHILRDPSIPPRSREYPFNSITCAEI